MDVEERRLTQIEADIKRLEDKVEQLPVLNERLNGIEKTMGELTDNVKSLRNTLITFALTVAGSAIAVLLGLTQIGGG